MRTHSWLPVIALAAAPGLGGESPQKPLPRHEAFERIARTEDVPWLERIASFRSEAEALNPPGYLLSGYALRSNSASRWLTAN